jgi:hypothetical protein
VAEHGQKGRAHVQALVCALALFSTALGALDAPGAAAASEKTINAPMTIENTTYGTDEHLVVAQGGVLTIRNATVLFNLTANGGLRLEVLPGGSLTIENSTLRPSDNATAAGWHWNFLVAGHLEVRHADISNLRGDPGLGGIEATGSDILIEDSYIHHNSYYGIMFHSGSATVRNTTFDANTVAVFVTPGASPTLEGLVIRNSTSFGLKINDAAPVVRNLTVTGSTSFSVGGVSATFDIVGCHLSGGDIAVDAVEGSTGRIEDCEFLTVATAVRVRDSPLRVAGSTFFSNGLGVNATSSAVDVENNSFIDVAVGVRAVESPAGVDIGQAAGNNFAGTGTGFEIYVPNFFLSDNTYGPQITGARVFHTMAILVVDKASQPVLHASVQLKASNDSVVKSGVTNDTGVFEVVLEEYRELPNGTRLNLTPYEVRIDAKGAVTFTELNATSERTERIMLQDPPAPTVLGITREGLLVLAAGLAAVAGAGAYGLRARRKRAQAKVEDRRGRGARRRGPRSGR